MDDLTASKLQNAYELIKAGKRAQAREILIPLRRANPDLADCWFLLGHAATDLEEKIRCFQQVVRLEPDNRQAQKQLARLLTQQAVSPAPGARRPAKSGKTNPALFWGLAALAGLVLCVAGLGLFWNFNNQLFTAPEPTLPVSAAQVVLPAAPQVAASATPVLSPTARFTSRPTYTLPPSTTPPPSLTILPTLTLTFTYTPTPNSEPKPKLGTGCAAPNGLGAQTAPFKIENFGKVGSVVYIRGGSKNGDHPISCQVNVKQGLPKILTLALGSYEYTVFRGSTTRNGTFVVNQTEKATMRIFDDKIQIGPFP